MCVFECCNGDVRRGEAKEHSLKVNHCNFAGRDQVFYTR